jgi:hypothetical protein
VLGKRERRSAAELPLAPTPALGLDDALDAIDQMLMLLMAAVDVTARVAYRVLGIGGTVFREELAGQAVPRRR